MNLYCAYLRDSGGSEQELSILQQEAALRAWCQENGARLSRLFIDAARPGSTTASRDAFEDMIDYLRRGGSGETGVLIWKFSRFSRDFDDAAFFKADLRRRGFDVISLQDNVPPGDEGRLLEAVIDYMNQRQLRDMSSDIRRGKRFMVTVHKAYPGGRPPVGYALAPDEAGLHRDGRPRRISRLVPDPLTAPLVRRAFEMRAGGATLPEILRACPVVKSIPALGRLLHNKTYIGILEYDNTDIHDYCPPLVDLPTWHAAQSVNRDRRARHGYDHPRAVRSRFLLTGLLHCSKCNRPMHGRIAQQKHYRSYDYYRCSSENIGHPCGAPLIPKGEIESRVIDRLTQKLLTPPVLSELYAEMRRQSDAGNARRQQDLSHLDHDLADISARLDRISAAIEAHGHTDHLLKRLGELEAEQSRLQDQRLDLLSSPSPFRGRAGEGVSLPDLDHASLAALADEAIAHLRGDPHQQTAVLRSFILEIRALKQNGALSGAITCHLPPSSKPLIIDL